MEQKQVRADDLPDAACVEEINDLIRTLVINQNVSNAMEYFRIAAFLRSIATMPAYEFEALVKSARRLADHCVKSINGGMERMSPPAREAARRMGMIPSPIDVSDVMRYVSEAEAQLRQFRRQVE